MATADANGKDAAAPTEPPPQMRRLLLGVAVWVCGWILGLALVPLVTSSGLSTSVKATLTGVLVIGFPKLFLLAAIAIMGKPGFAYLKSIVLGHLKRYAPPAEVSLSRYRVGMVILVVMVAYGWLEPYVGDILPGQGEHPKAYALASDLLLLASFFILGGDFWDKLRALFIREAKAQFPAKAGA